VNVHARNQISKLASDGRLLFNQRNFSAAAVRFNEAAAKYEILGFDHEAAGCRNMVGHCYVQLGRPDAAVDEFQSAFQKLMALGQYRDAAEAALSLGAALSDSGQLFRARHVLKSTAELYRTLGDFTGEANALQNLRNLSS
jgi:tetratricopeptide (TPR) repeat protein